MFVFCEKIVIESMESGHNHLSCSFFFFFYIYFIHSYSVFVGFISTDDSLKALSSLGKKRKASQGTEDMTEDYAGIFTTNNEYLCG